jgi:hypothetical protein
MSYELPIVGPTQLPGFNGVGIIDLNDYLSNGVTPPEMEGYVFEYLTHLELSTVDEYDPSWLNDLIRSEGTTEERIDKFDNEFEVGGFKTCYEPPMLDTAGVPIDGRGRVLAAKKRGEKRIPIYVYSRIDKTETCRVANGLISNLKHGYATKASREDCVISALGLIKLGELKNDEADIRSFLMQRIHINNYFNARNITLIVNAVMKRADAGDAVVRVESREAQLRWLDKKAGIKIDNKKTWLFSVEQDTYAMRAFCQGVLDSVINDKNPAEIVLYTNSHLHSVARENINKFVADLEFYISAAYKMVAKDIFAGNNQMISAFKCNVKPYVILGARPQLIGCHDLESNKLVPIDQY